MKRLLILTLTLVSLLNTRAQDTVQFVVSLHGGNEVPPNASPYKGAGGFLLEGNTLSFGVSLPWPNLTPSGAGIYGPAARGTNGNLIFDWPDYRTVINLNPLPGLPWGYLLYEGAYTLTPDQVTQLKAGLWYVNIKSTDFPNGELRGQILLPDSDGDGVSDDQDVCPDTLPGVVADANGCSIEQLCPCSGPWKDHREYVKSVKEQAFRFWKEGRITVHQRNAIVKEAAQSNCGNPLPPPNFGTSLPVSSGKLVSKGHSK